MGRPPSVVVSPTALLEEWKELLDKRFPCFKWDGSDYQRPSRNQAVDKPGLEVYLKPLRVLLKHAPTGFPTQTSLRETFELCDTKYGILSNNEAGRQTADIWRTNV